MSAKETTRDIDKNEFPTREGKYMARGVWAEDRDERVIDVYIHPIKGLCCFSEDFGSGGTGVDEKYDCHVSVQCSGLKFIRRIGDLD